MLCRQGDGVAQLGLDPGMVGRVVAAVRQRRVANAAGQHQPLLRRQRGDFFHAEFTFHRAAAAAPHLHGTIADAASFAAQLRQGRKLLLKDRKTDRLLDPHGRHHTPDLATWGSERQTPVAGRPAPIPV